MYRGFNTLALLSPYCPCSHLMLPACLYSMEPKACNIEANKAAPPPSNKDTLRYFLGLCKYYVQFIPGYALQVQPLHALLKKGVKFVWDTQTNEVFNDLKKISF